MKQSKKTICPLSGIYLDTGADVNAEDEDHLTPLQVSAQRNRIEIAELLLDRGADINKRDRKDPTPLLLAAIYNHAQFLRLLIDRGADVNLAACLNETHLNSAACISSSRPQKRRLNTVPDSGAVLGRCWLPYRQAVLFDDALYSCDWAPLHIAAMFGDVENAEYLLDHGAATDRGDIYVHLPVHYAAQYGHAEIVRLLHSHGADVCESDFYLGSSPIGKAARNGIIETVRCLLDLGVDVNTVDDDRLTPLFSGVAGQDSGTVKFLIDRGANVSYKDDECGDTPLHWVADRSNTEIVQMLLERGADVNAIGYERGTPLHVAADSGRIEHVKVLLCSGADRTVRDKDDLTPLALAERKQHTDVVRLLSDVLLPG